jgi:hypothetical protein
MSGSIGGVDIRLPMGSIIGIITTIHGLMGPERPRGWPDSIQVNINLVWGLVLLAFGAAMLGLAWMAAQAKK